MEMLISRIRDSEHDVQRTALQALQELVRTSQGNVGEKIQNILDYKDEIQKSLDWTKGENRQILFDLLSVIYVLDDSPAALEYRLQGNVIPLSEWNHQYVKKLIKCIVDSVSGKTESIEFDCLVEPIIKFLLDRNGEIEAIDFIAEISSEELTGGNGMKMTLFDSVIKTISGEEAAEEDGGAPAELAFPRRASHSYFPLLTPLIDQSNRSRILTYLWELSKFYDLERILLELTSHDPSTHLVCLLRYGRLEQSISFVRSIKDARYKKQCLYILARNSIYYEGKDEEEYILSNQHVRTIYAEVAEALENAPPRKLDYMFKGLNKDRIDTAAVANALIHFGYKRDPVFFPQEEDFRIKEEYLEQLLLNKSISTAASVGLINAFDPNSVCDYYSQNIFSTPEPGAILALALSSYKMHDKNSTILNLLSVFLSSDDPKEVIAMLMGISIVYADGNNPEVYELVFPLLSSDNNDVCLFAIYVLGCVFPGDMDILESCVDIYKELTRESPFSIFAILGMALFFYRQGVCIHPEYNSCDNRVQELFDQLDSHTKVLATGFGNIGTGNAAIIDALFSNTFVGEIDALIESLGILSAALVGVGDPLAVGMLERIVTSALLLDSPHLRNVVPSCIALLYASNPKPDIIDSLERLINSGDSSVNALVSLGIVGAGTCSSRVLRILDFNFSSVFKDSKNSSALIYSQGLVNLGKGLVTLSPLYYDKQVLSRRSIIGLISTFFLFIEPGITKDHSFLLFLITSAVSTKYVAGFEGEIRVGNPVDTVGMVGQPNRINAAIVHSMPVILNEDQRAEVEISICTNFVEDVVIKQ